MDSNVVFSKITGTYIPVQIKQKCQEATSLSSKTTQYDVYDGKKNIGYVLLRDTDYGCYVQNIVNLLRGEYKEFARLADKLEVNYCLEKCLSDFEIRAYAVGNSHSLHYLRGNRFEGTANSNKIERFMQRFNNPNIKSFGYNSIVKYIIEHTPRTERYNTMFLGDIPMYMPKSLIQKYIKALIENPIKFV